MKLRNKILLGAAVPFSIPVMLYPALVRKTVELATTKPAPDRNTESK